MAELVKVEQKSESDQLQQMVFDNADFGEVRTVVIDGDPAYQRVRYVCIDLWKQVRESERIQEMGNFRSASNIKENRTL